MNAKELALAFEMSKQGLEHDVAEVLAVKHAGRVTVGTSGEPDAASVVSVAKEVVATAPATFRRTTDGDRPQFSKDVYEAIRGRERARQAATAVARDARAEALRRLTNRGD